MKLSITEHMSECMRIFILHDFHQCLDLKLDLNGIVAYIQGANEADFDVVYKITERYQWKKNRSENGLDSILL